MTRQGLRYWGSAVVLCLSSVWAQTVHATGITADVGLTPPLDRWIFRSQLRYLERQEDSSPNGQEMEMYMMPVVVAYGLRPELTVIARQPFLHREMAMPMGNMNDTGYGDFSLITKYRMFRVNRPEYILGIAPILGLECPTGDDDFGSDTWDLLTGVFVSGRTGPSGVDLNLEYKLNGLGDRGGDLPGDELTTTVALAYQFTLNDDATMSLWPVLEISHTYTEPDRQSGHTTPNSGEEILLLSPGLKFARQSFMLELLVQFPVHQDQRGNQMERGIGGLIGVRYMF